MMEDTDILEKEIRKLTSISPEKIKDKDLNQIKKKTMLLDKYQMEIESLLELKIQLSLELKEIKKHLSIL